MQAGLARPGLHVYLGLGRFMVLMYPITTVPRSPLSALIVLQVYSFFGLIS